MSRRVPRERRETRSWEYTKDVIRVLESSQRCGSNAALGIWGWNVSVALGGVAEWQASGLGLMHLRWGEAIDGDSPAYRKPAGACSETGLGVGPFLQQRASGT
jgi:hypothetical protein